jgi:dihydropteroate synthase
MNRKIYFWKLPSTELAMGERTLIMGVLNVTPDSFSDGGRFSDPDRAYARALEMEEQGADIIDLGAESTRPDSKRISAEEEWRRLLPVLKLLRDKLTVPLSLDTYKSEIAERAVQYGVSIFNDPSGLTFDANLAKVAAEHNAGLILNHMRGTPETWGMQTALADVMAAVSKDLEATVSRARRAGVEKNRIMVDPGLGFGKRKEQNSELIAHLGRLAELDYPILAGPSRKSFLNPLPSGQGGEAETVFATAAAVTAAILFGAHVVRVHDVKEMRSAAKVADEILRVAAVHQAVQEAAEEQQRTAVRPKVRLEGAATFMTGDRARPTRPPLARPALPAEEIVVELPVVPEGTDSTDAPEANKETAEELPRQAATEPIEMPPPADRPKPYERKPPPEGIGERPAFRRPAADRPPRRDSGDRPPRREFKPAADRPRGDRPARPFADRPPRPGGDRPSRPFGDRPPRPSGDRPVRPFGDRPPRSGGDDRRPPRPSGDRPQRPFGDRPPRPFGDRPPRPSGDRPTRPGGDRPARGDERPRSFRPGGDRDRPRGDRPGSGDRPGGGDRPPRSGPPRGGSGPGRPPGGRPPRPFRKRP